MGRCFNKNSRNILTFCLMSVLAAAVFATTVSSIQAQAWDGIDAVFYRQDGKAFMFNGGDYTRYDIETMKRDEGYPKLIIDSFQGLTFIKDLDAVFNRDDGKAFFFKGDEYIRYDIKTMKRDPGYPKKIIDGFQGLTFMSDIDAAFDREDGKVFFFKGDEYIRYDVKTMKRDEGYPKKIMDGFQGILIDLKAGGEEEGVESEDESEKKSEDQ